MCSTITIVDPTAEEESLSTALLTVVTDEEDRMCAVHKPGKTGHLQFVKPDQSYVSHVIR